MNALGRALLAIPLALMSLSAITERVRQQGVTDTEIRIGNLMPYSGNMEAFGAIGKLGRSAFVLKGRVHELVAAVNG